MIVRAVGIPLLDPSLTYDVTTADGVFTAITPVGEGPAAYELWPGYVEAHAHYALPPNLDDTLDDPRIVALQYAYHGVTAVADMFGYPLVKDLWELGRSTSDLPYPELVHCGYASTSMRDSLGRTGHGVEFPAPVFMLGAAGEIDDALLANGKRGASFAKVMFTDGTEVPENEQRFSRISPEILRDVARATVEAGIPAVLDCNTRYEVQLAYSMGFRNFAHSVRDHELSAADWDGLAGARFVSTLGGLRPMIMTGQEFADEYGRAGFAETQDPVNLPLATAITEPFGIGLGTQEDRTVSLRNMRLNTLAALQRGQALVGTDSGNTGAFHGYTLLGELDLIAGDLAADTELRRALRAAITVGNRRYFDDLSGVSSTDQPVAVGAPATYNLLAADVSLPLAALPVRTVVNGAELDRGAVLAEIAALRASGTGGKVIL